MEFSRFYHLVHRSVSLPPSGRRSELRALHDQVLRDYLDALKRIDHAESSRTGTDGRTIAEVVGHIAAWERWAILAVTEVLAGVRWPRLLDLRAYPEFDSPVRDFASQDAFNAYSVQKQEGLSWCEIRAAAVGQATSLYGLLARPGVVPLCQMEATTPCQWQLGDGKSFPQQVTGFRPDTGYE